MKGILLIGLFGLFFSSSFHAQAALLYMDPNVVDISRGDTVKVSIRLDTEEDECVNVVDAVITYPDTIEPVDVSRGSSIMSIWVEEPIINKENNTITFAGGIPNGYCGRIAGDPRLTNVVLDLLFQSPGLVVGSDDVSGEIVINFDPQTQVLLNDGLGAQAPLSLLGAQINLSKTAGGNIDNQWADIISADKIYPEKFSISLERTKNAYSNDWFIVFNTTDKQSGIDHYEVIEESMEEAGLFNWGREDAPWVEAKSPYVLKDQSLNSTIRVRAIDKAGNEYVATYVPDEAQRTISTESKILIAVVISVVVLFVCGIVIGVLLHIRKKRSVLNLDDDLVNMQ